MMLGEQVNDTRDSAILERYSYEDDIDKESLRIFRQIFLIRKPDHPFHVSDDKEFLRQLGGLGIDRVSGEEYLTLAGLLMFGKFRSILDAVPNY
jgi:predicted HTH transcriptional regulator